MADNPNKAKITDNGTDKNQGASLSHERLNSHEPSNSHERLTNSSLTQIDWQRFDDGSYSSSSYIHRDLSLLQFNLRVLAQAASPRHPLLERLFFLIILSSNMDEFFEIRVARA